MEQRSRGCRTARGSSVVGLAEVDQEAGEELRVGGKRSAPIAGGIDLGSQVQPWTSPPASSRGSRSDGGGNVNSHNDGKAKATVRRADSMEEPIAECWHCGVGLQGAVRERHSQGKQCAVKSMFRDQAIEDQLVDLDEGTGSSRPQQGQGTDSSELPARRGELLD